ncbi:uncharacterized protein LOC123962369 [Micropterus dolomieu]|uniref:uncharacterized protein LOC123962369 n=1 Tax=Micropterus dolomieu TaxID=147949 RepID=UPI001E8D3954|nr:uncharacterized protein LOC123962369 [Micropterus dolomieu]
MQEQTLELLARDVFNVLQICKQIISTPTPNCNMTGHQRSKQKLNEKLKTEQDQELSKEEVWYDTFTDLKEDEPEKVSSGENLVVTSTNAVTSIEGKVADEEHNLNKPSPSKDAVKAAEADESACHNTATTSATKIVSQEDAITDEPAMNEKDDVAACRPTATTSATKIVSQEDAITDEPAMNEKDDVAACRPTATTSATKIVSQEDAITDEPVTNENNDDDVVAFQTTAHPVQEGDKLGHLVTPKKRSCVTQFFRSVFKPFSACLSCVCLD